MQAAPSSGTVESVYDAHGVACQKKAVPILTAAVNTNLEKLT
jgi:hypothetical protein